MSERTSKKKQNEAKNINRKMLVTWGLPICFLLAVLSILTTNFSAVSSSAAREDIKEQILSDSNFCAAEISKEVSEMTIGGSTAATLIHEDGYTSQFMSADYAEAIQEAIDASYMVCIVDKEGKGYCSEGYEVDISGTDYFTSFYRQSYLHTMDDGILHNEAFISMIPFYGQYTHDGMIYIYTSVENIRKQLPVYSYNGQGSFVIIDNLGSIVSKSGKDNEFLAGRNLFEALQESSLTDIEYKRILNRIEKKEEYYFSATLDGKSYAFAVTPTSFKAWYFVLMVPQEEVNRLENEEWAASRSLNSSIMFTMIIFVVLLISMNIIIRIQMARQNKDLETKADTDLLTGLSNKIATERLIQEFAEDFPDGQSMFIILDIDNFKKINDTMGHAFGDDILRSLGHQLRSEFRITDIIGRTGGDEFILFLKFIKTDELLDKEAKRILDFFRQFKGGGEYVKYTATASIGVSVFPRDGKDYASLYRAADSALYEAKRKGKNQLVFFDKSFEKENAGMRKTAPIDNDGSKKK